MGPVTSMRFARVQAILDNEAGLVKEMAGPLVMIYDRWGYELGVSPLTVKVVWFLAKHGHDAHKVYKQDVLKAAIKVISGAAKVPKTIKFKNMKKSYVTPLPMPDAKGCAELDEVRKRLNILIGQKEAAIKALTSEIGILRQKLARSDLAASLLSSDIPVEELEALAAKHTKNEQADELRRRRDLRGLREKMDQAKQKPLEPAAPKAPEQPPPPPPSSESSKPKAPPSGVLGYPKPQERASQIECALTITMKLGAMINQEVMVGAKVSNRTVNILKALFRAYPVGNPLLTAGVEVTPYWKQHPLTAAQITQMAGWISNVGWPAHIDIITSTETRQWASIAAHKLQTNYPQTWMAQPRA